MSYINCTLPVVGGVAVSRWTPAPAAVRGVVGS